MFLHMTRLVVDSPQLATPSANTSRICPSPLQRDVGINQQGVGGGETRGGTHEVGGPSSALRKWAMTNVIARFLPFLLPSPATNACYTQPATTTTSLASKCEPEEVTQVVSTRLLPPPPPSHPNASRRWFFSLFRHDSHHHHLPHVQTRAGGGHFHRFDMTPTTTTSLASKHEPEVVLFGGFDASPTTTTSLASKCELEVVIFGISTVSHHYHLPRHLPPPPHHHRPQIDNGENG